MLEKWMKNRRTRRRQGHKLVWFTLIVLAIPAIILGSIIMSASNAQGKPVVGSRYGKDDLKPAIEQKQLDQLSEMLKTIGGVEAVEVNLKAATLRVSIDVSDDAGNDGVNAVADQAYNVVAQLLPIETYFTDSDTGKMYDLEVGVYNFLVDDNHPADQFIYEKITKTGAGQRVVDVFTTPDDADLVNQITRAG